MRSFLEQSVLVRAAPEVVFALYADVPGWAGWDPDVRAASIDGPFVTGAVGSLTPMKGPRNRIAFVSVVPGRSFDVEARLPLCTMRLEHVLDREGECTRVTHRVLFRGPLALLFGWLVGRGIRAGMPGTLAGLRAACEVQPQTPNQALQRGAVVTAIPAP